MNNLNAFNLYLKGDLAGAMRAIGARLNEDPGDIEALFIAAQVCAKEERHGLAANLYERILAMVPEDANAWNNLGHAYHGMADYRTAAGHFLKSLRFEGDNYAAYNNLILMHMNLGDIATAKRLYRLAMFHAETDEQRQEVTGTISLALLAQRQWSTGWDAYDCMLHPNKLRKELDIGLPRWDGAAGERVAVYTEQGLGEELLFASCIPQLQADCDFVLECDARLVGIFKRSFGCAVYGSRFTGERAWLSDHALTAKCAIGSLPRFYRRSESDFPGQPYLKADPERRVMARALLDQWPGRKIGLAWSGGQKHTRDKDRSLSLEQLEPLLSLPGITWVSLQYKGGAPDDPRIKHVPFLTQTADYDDTAALVAELDSVVSVTTTVAFLAGALGTDCHVAVPSHPTWHWCRDGVLPWFPLKLYRRPGLDWAPVVEQIKEQINAA